MYTEIYLKEQLHAIAQNKFSVPPSIEPFELALNMVNHIGSSDSQLRDDLIYTAFATWILDYKLFNNGQLSQLLFSALDDKHMFYCIGEKNTDSVFMRSFSVLLLPLILIANRERPFLTKSDIQHIKTKLLQYLDGEKDLRGYVEESGWIHAIAHVADAFDDLAQCPELEASDLQEILEAISVKMCVGDKPYVYEEDERMTTAVIRILERQVLGEAETEKWVRNFVILLQQIKPNPKSYEHFNVKNFLRSLYFRMYQKNAFEKLCQTINETLSEISHFKD